jgi:hypothetical protein
VAQPFFIAWAEDAVQEGELLADCLALQALTLLGDEVVGDELGVDALQRSPGEERCEVLVQHDGVVLERRRCITWVHRRPLRFSTETTSWVRCRRAALQN